MDIKGKKGSVNEESEGRTRFAYERVMMMWNRCRPQSCSCSATTQRPTSKKGREKAVYSWLY